MGLESGVQETPDLIVAGGTWATALRGGGPFCLGVVLLWSVVKSEEIGTPKGHYPVTSDEVDFGGFSPARPLL